jgi:uncharacterized protein (DUF2384 family)
MISLLEEGAFDSPFGLPTPVSADRLSSYNRLVARVVDVFGDETQASRWLSRRSADFSGQSPLEAAEKQGYDPQAVEPVLLRLEHGIDF